MNSILFEREKKIFLVFPDSLTVHPYCNKAIVNLYCRPFSQGVLCWPECPGQSPVKFCPGHFGFPQLLGLDGKTTYNGDGRYGETEEPGQNRNIQNTDKNPI